MTKFEAVKIASNHIEVMNQNNPNSDTMNWTLSECVEYDKGFYFDYKLELINPEDGLAFGGPPGFLILKESSVVLDLSWSELKELKDV